MLTDEGGQALLDFTAKTDTVIVTFSMAESQLELLDTQLREWQSAPSVEKELKIIENFAETDNLADRTRPPDKY